MFGSLTSQPTVLMNQNNQEYAASANLLSEFNWEVYGFNSGHFISSIWSLGLPFNIMLECDPYVSGQALFTEFTSCFNIFSGASELLDHI